MEYQYEIFGMLHKVLPPSKFVLHGRENKTQVFAIKTDSKDTREVAFTLYNNAMDKLAHIHPGDKVRVVFEMESKFINEKYFNNNKCINLQKIE